MKNSPKKKRHPNYRRVKIHRSYTVEEIAGLYDIHKNTVRGWIKVGLAVIVDIRPKLILGHDLRAFLQARRAKNKRPCKPGELYCVRCRAPKFPAADMVDYFPVTESYGNMKGICPDCDAIMNLRVSVANLEKIREKWNVQTSQALERLIERNKLTVNSDLRQE